LTKTRLDAYLTDAGYYESRARAASAIKAGKVTIDGRVVLKPASKVSDNQHIIAEQEFPWVSRGGQKLAYALEVFKVSAKDRICLDIGSSTGGFTDVLLNGGAAKIYAVDVGRDQLNQKLRANPKVISMEQTDARQLSREMLDELPDLFVCDASFISLIKLLETPLSFANPGAELITLVKPQFEVGRDYVGKGGIIKDQVRTQESIQDVLEFITALGWRIAGRDTSPIKGGDGNTEYLIYAVKMKNPDQGRD